MNCWTQRNGRKIYFFSAGTGEPVILLHPSLLTGRAWLPQVNELVNAGFRVIVPDFAGHGVSDSPTKPFTVSDLVADLWSIYDILAMQTATLIGVSLGGLVALAAATQQPDRVSQLAISGTGSSTNFPEFVQFAKTWGEDLRSAGGPLRSLDLIWKRNLSLEFQNSEAGHSTYQLWHAELAKSDGKGLAFVVEGTSGFDIPDLSRWTKRTLLLAAENDPASTMLKQLQSTLCRTVIASIPRAHHFANIDAAGAFTAALLGFLQRSNLGT